MKKYLILSLATLLLLLTFLGYKFFLAEPEVIKIGLLVQLSGPGSELGVNVRNGVRIAIKEINQQGGIKGKKIVLLVEDNKQDPALAQKLILKLIQQKVKAIIGPITSNIALKIVPLANKHQVILLSPTVSTPLLAEKDDYFFRLESPSTEEARQLAQFARNFLKLNKVGILWDAQNQAYTYPYQKTFVQEFTQLGGKIAFNLSYKDNYQHISSTSLSHFSSLTPKDGLLFISNDQDLLKGAEFLISPAPIILSAGWAMTQTIKINYPILFRKKIFFASTSYLKKTVKEKQFDQIYLNNYGRLPNFAAYRGYDSLKVLAKALSLGDDLKKELLKIKNFPGLQYKITFNRFGDLNLPVHIYTLKNEDFSRVEYGR